MMSPNEERLIELGERIMRAITETMLDIGMVTGDATYEDAEDTAFDCVVAIAELLELPCDFEVTADFRRRLKEAVHNEQFVLTSIRDAEES